MAAHRNGLPGSLPLQKKHNKKPPCTQSPQMDRTQTSTPKDGESSAPPQTASVIRRYYPCSLTEWLKVAGGVKPHANYY